MLQHVFTTGCLDNIDHNPSATLSHDSFHGTAISVTQHITNDVPGEARDVLETFQPTESQLKFKAIPEFDMLSHVFSVEMGKRLSLAHIFLFHG